MKDILIKGTALKREIVIWTIALVVSVGINIYAIVKYGNSWSEILTQLPVVVLISVLLYLLIWVLRGILKTIRKILLLFKG
jgi:glucan phosphoethanolaminetransferase (alkaline phosphatase superfamily)